MKKAKDFIRPGILVVFLILLDQITKLLASLYLKGIDAFPIIKNVFELRYLENTSAAFSLDPITLIHRIFHIKAFENPQTFLRAKMVFFVVLTIAVLVFLFFLYRKLPSGKKFIWMNLTIEFFFAGAIGNCIDRIWHNYVIDFFYFRLINFPIFNVADIYVTCAAISFVLLLLFYYKEADFKEV